MPLAPAHETLVFVGTQCYCQRVHGQDRYLVCARADGRTLGTIRWHPRQQRYVLVPANGTAWSSRDLSEVGLWVRRLSREALRDRPAHGRGL